ncbi:hypothetical protein OG689_12445 [Kitasatospora sp. NBC_00240]|uniref:hypothetical protein n=1 Tax=Kitasatospora sp. NBC_00240 TaxID=2903567 RepID=UPI0022592489|nr:hypothetical protein [Kitasatospora sp. NBC_00240]MCX5210092.1 hypothetical protein [Kitasatospora sp. NBC_00240]
MYSAASAASGVRELKSALRAGPGGEDETGELTERPDAEDVLVLELDLVDAPDPPGVLHHGAFPAAAVLGPPPVPVEFTGEGRIVENS